MPSVSDGCVPSSVSFLSYTSDFLATVLSRLKPTSPGPDGLPAWLFKACAEQLSSVMVTLINHSLRHSDVPVCWLTATITPIPKIKPPTVPSDLRPISVTPIFSRITERLVVRDYILPAITLESLYDQYAYKPSGSTTCALIDFTHRINTLLETNKYARCIFVDLSKAFDTVCHYILAQKLIKLKMPPFVVGWIMAFLSNRTHATKLGFLLSNLAAFNMSVVQGSGIGPFLFIVYMLDLRALDIFIIS